MNKSNTSKGFANVSIKICKYVIMVVVIVICATAAFNFGSSIFYSEGVDPSPGTDMPVTVKEGTTIDDLADTLEEYIESKARLKRAIEELESKIADFQTHTPSNSPSKHDVLSRVRTVYDIIRNPDVDYSIKGTLMRSLVEDIVYDKENGRIIFHLYIS